jgi:hypothetical protein
MDRQGTLGTRHNIALWTGETGDSREALRLFQDLLPDQERVLGEDHPDTETTRAWIQDLEASKDRHGRSSLRRILRKLLNA